MLVATDSRLKVLAIVPLRESHKLEQITGRWSRKREEGEMGKGGGGREDGERRGGEGEGRRGGGRNLMSESVSGCMEDG